MAHYRASESKREQFRRYLEKSGVLDTLTSVLVALYEEGDKPNNALEYPSALSVGVWAGEVTGCSQIGDETPGDEVMTHLVDFNTCQRPVILTCSVRKHINFCCVNKMVTSQCCFTEPAAVVTFNLLHSFIKLHLGAAGPEPADTEALRMELSDLQLKCNLLMEENKELRNRLMQYEPSPEEGATE
ncbi:hypothetical protein INR49_010737 [Caranx melampygus]|nr:hypothetical protein INR49_010737 [Caranx melampygus]